MNVAPSGIPDVAVGADDERPRVLYEKVGRVARVTLNRPDCLNAMDLRTHEELGRIWDDFERDDGIWVGVLTGAGDRAFSVGQDLKELVARTRSGVPPSTFGSRGASGYPRLTERFSLSKPVIARVNGFAFGGGFELALACDVIVASETAEFALPEAKLGLVPGAGGIFRLVRQAPFKIAMGYLMTGRRIPAAMAMKLGLVNEVAPLADLDAVVNTWIEDILNCSPLAVRAIKEVACKSVDLTLPEAFAATYVWEERRRAGLDWKEGPLAFHEKRRPCWSDC